MKILWVDMNASAGNPSMQHLVASLDAFLSEGLDIRIVCETCQPSLQSRVFYRLAEFRGNLRSLLFSFRANWCFLTNPALKREKALTHSTGANLFGADLISLHFIPGDWLRILILSPEKTWKDWMKVPIYTVATALEWVQRRSCFNSHFHVVSRSLADSLERKGVPAQKITVIPTPYDASSFNLAARCKHRESARRELRFSDGDVVFSFISQGNYHRKGVYQAARIVKLLREMGRRAHLLIIGGSGSSWVQMKTTMQKRFPGAESWLHITGYVPNLVRTLAAADAFLLPSLYEGFAAVEVEAAAMGLPLLLTAHPGTELILKPGANGWQIDFKPEIAAQQINEVFSSIRPMDQADVGEAVTLEVWQKKYMSLYRALLEKSRA